MEKVKNQRLLDMNTFPQTNAGTKVKVSTLSLFSRIRLCLVALGVSLGVIFLMTGCASDWWNMVR